MERWHSNPNLGALPHRVAGLYGRIVEDRDGSILRVCKTPEEAQQAVGEANAAYNPRAISELLWEPRKPRRKPRVGDARRTVVRRRKAS